MPQYSTPIPKPYAQTPPKDYFWGQSSPSGYQWKATPTSPTLGIPATTNNPATAIPQTIAPGTSSGGFQDQWLAAGHEGTAPVGYQGESDVANLQDQQRNEINSGYDSYFSGLNDMLNQGLPDQRAAQEQIAQSQYDQGYNSLTTQKNLGEQELGATRGKVEGQQKRTLQDLTDNIRNLFQSGNVYLGARGAGDSSASNQYAYALTQMGSKQRGDITGKYAEIQSDIDGRESRLNEIYKGETNNLQTNLNQQIAGIAQWFSSAQNQIKQMQAQGQLSRGQDLAQLSQNALNYALQQLQMVQQEAAQRRSGLEQWALSNSQNINQLKSNLASISQKNYNAPSATPLQGLGTTGAPASAGSLYGYGGQDTQKTDMFGNPIA